jgi:hypothetical protein
MDRGKCNDVPCKSFCRFLANRLCWSVSLVAFELNFYLYKITEISQYKGTVQHGFIFMCQLM